MIVVVVDSNIGVIHVKYLRVVPVFQTLRSLALLRLYLEHNFNPLCIMLYSLLYFIRLLQTRCLPIAMRVAKPLQIHDVRIIMPDYTLPVVDFFILFF